MIFKQALPSNKRLTLSVKNEISSAAIIQAITETFFKFGPRSFK